MATLKRRKWLNSNPTRTAFISTDIGTEDYFRIYGTVKLSDCDRNILLEFDTKNDRETRERIKKVDILIDELTAVREFLETHGYD